MECDKVMLQAKTKTGELVMLSTIPLKDIQQLRKSTTFYCPDCKERVIIKAGTEIIPHFAHERNSNCDIHGGEGPYHEKGKYLLYRWLKGQHIDVKLEAYLPEIKQRPDILVCLHQKLIAVEFQCAKVSPQIIRKRNEGYMRAGIIPIWILGSTLLRRYHNNMFQLNQFMTHFIHQFTPGYPTTLYFLCPHKKQVSIISDIHQFSMQGAIGKFIQYSLRQMTFKQLFPRRYIKENELLTHWFRRVSQFRVRERRRVQGNDLIWRNWLYKRKIYIDQLPSYLFLPIRTQPFMRVALYDWQSRLLVDYLSPLKINEVVCIKDAMKSVEKQMRQTDTYPLWRKQNNPIWEYFDALVLFGVLEADGDTSFKKVKPIPFYASIHEAIAGDRQLFKDINRKLRNIMLHKG